MRPLLRSVLLISLGAVVVLAALALLLLFLPRLLTVDHLPEPADAIVVLSGSGSRLNKGVELYYQKMAPRLILTANKNESWQQVAKKICPDCQLEKWGAIVLDGSIDTRTDAELSLRYCRDNNLHKILVVTSPYHTRRTQFVFNDIFEGSAIEPIVISSNSYEKYVSPDGRWWADRRTLETVWLEFGKILYWELTPFMEFQGEGERLKESERAR